MINNETKKLDPKNVTIDVFKKIDSRIKETANQKYLLEVKDTFGKYKYISEMFFDMFQNQNKTAKNITREINEIASDKLKRTNNILSYTQTIYFIRERLGSVIEIDTKKNKPQPKSESSRKLKRDKKKWKGKQKCAVEGCNMPRKTGNRFLCSIHDKSTNSGILDAVVHYR